MPLYSSAQCAAQIGVSKSVWQRICRDMDMGYSDYDIVDIRYGRRGRTKAFYEQELADRAARRLAQIEARNAKAMKYRRRIYLGDEVNPRRPKVEAVQVPVEGPTKFDFEFQLAS